MRGHPRGLLISCMTACHAPDYYPHRRHARRPSFIAGENVGGGYPPPTTYTIQALADFLGWLVAAFADYAIPGPISVRVVRVLDGDTITVDAEPWLGITISFFSSLARARSAKRTVHTGQ